MLKVKLVANAQTHFQGFGGDALNVFRRLAENNSREVFLAGKAEYERTLKEPAMDLVADLNDGFSKAGLSLHDDPKRALFRPNRDVRFSKDKSPYKLNISFVLTRSGEKRDNGLFYFQFGLEAIFAAAGFYQLDPAELAAFRGRILDRGPEWRAIRSALENGGLELSRENAAKRPPRGVPADLPEDLRADILLKSYVVRRPLSSEDVGRSGLVATLVAFATKVNGLLEFGWSALAP